MPGKKHRDAKSIRASDEWFEKWTRARLGVMADKTEALDAIRSVPDPFFYSFSAFKMMDQERQREVVEWAVKMANRIRSSDAPFFEDVAGILIHHDPPKVARKSQLPGPPLPKRWPKRADGYWDDERKKTTKVEKSWMGPASPIETRILDFVMRSGCPAGTVTASTIRAWILENHGKSEKIDTLTKAARRVGYRLWIGRPKKSAKKKK
jgi:hypothetical protein